MSCFYDIPNVLLYWGCYLVLTSLRKTRMHAPMVALKRISRSMRVTTTSTKKSNMVMPSCRGVSIIALVIPARRR